MTASTPRTILSFCDPCCSNCPRLLADGSFLDDYGNRSSADIEALHALIADAASGTLADRLERSELHPERPLVLRYGGTTLHFAQSELDAFVEAARDGSTLQSLTAAA